mmetsp:Transcript_18448/g.39912  ORF Transcript_18448/g.39912 Transcript_18448/m.39912 type:complete len:91 (-) Transcript_18448:2312-2584(-)
MSFTVHEMSSPFNANVIDAKLQVLIVCWTDPIFSFIVSEYLPKGVCVNLRFLKLPSRGTSLGIVRSAGLATVDILDRKFWFKVLRSIDGG